MFVATVTNIRYATSTTIAITTGNVSIIARTSWQGSSLIWSEVSDPTCGYPKTSKEGQIVSVTTKKYPEFLLNLQFCSFPSFCLSFRNPGNRPLNNVWSLIPIEKKCNLQMWCLITIPKRYELMYLYLYLCLYLNLCLWKLIAIAKQGRSKLLDTTETADNWPEHWSGRIQDSRILSWRSKIVDDCH